MKNELGVAILGCGYWGANYVRVFNELPDSRVAAVCDQREERLREIRRRFPRVPLTTDIDEMLQQEDVDTVVVCTQAKSHYEVTRRCLKAGKHVLVEKPLTTVSAHAEELTNLAESLGLTLMVGHTFVYNSGVRKVKDYIDQDQVGRVYYLYACRTNLGPIRQDVNALWDLATHDVSIFNYLLGAVPEWVSAVGVKVLRNCREDVGFVSLGYPNDVVGHIHVSWADPNKAREVVVVGSERRILFNDLNGLEQVRVFEKGVKPVSPEPQNFGEYHFQLRDGDILSPRLEVTEPLKNQCQHFLECARSGCRPLTSGWEGHEVVKVLEAIDRSIQKNGAQVEIGISKVHNYARQNGSVANLVR